MTSFNHLDLSLWMCFFLMLICGFCEIHETHWYKPLRIWFSFIYLILIEMFRYLRSIWLIHLSSLTCVCYVCLCCFIFIHMWSMLGDYFDAFLCQIPLIHIELNLVCLLLTYKVILPLRYSFYDSMACIQLQVHFDDFWKQHFSSSHLVFIPLWWWDL